MVGEVLSTDGGFGTVAAALEAEAETVGVEAGAGVLCAGVFVDGVGDCAVR